MTRPSLVLFASMLSAAGVLAACTETTKPPVSRTPTAADSAEQIMTEVVTTLFQKGLRRGELFADTAYTFDEQTRLVFRNPRVNFNTEKGAPNGALRADRGHLNLRTQIFEGFGNVVITSTDGKRLSSPQVRYNQLANEISSDTTFEVVQGDRVQRGIGFTADPNITRWSCKRSCSGS
ncbi:MAG TPA: LPS export ABC transporter periplasmic protein LptC, partial [Gemmatimonadaceae bacterium]|nr:LPS export ABC transporter periplasmic protein LptC [Gemmatimonadaceae bacterium]